MPTNPKRKVKGQKHKCKHCPFYTYEELNLIHHENMYHGKVKP